jgi:predicted nucleic acid-binding protein
MIVVLDSGPLGLLAHPNAIHPQVKECNEWVLGLVNAERRVVIPEIVDYELRRELLRLGKSESISRLYELGAIFEYMPLTTPLIRRAASFWAEARRSGKPTASDAALDIDMILAAHAATLHDLFQDKVVVATTNVRHLRLFVDAEHWSTVE